MTTKPNTLRLARIHQIIAEKSGLDPSTSQRTADTLALLDAEKVGSVVSIIESFYAKRDAIEADKRLSELGKQEQIRAAADSHLGNIAIRARKLAEIEVGYATDKVTAVPLPKADAADVALDLALVDHVKALNPIPSKLVEMSERVRLAVARTPIELSGLSPELQARVHGSLMSPAKAVQLSSESTAIQSARQLVQTSIDELGPQAGWSPKEWVQQFGAGNWRLPGITDSLAQKLNAEGTGD